MSSVVLPRAQWRIEKKLAIGLLKKDPKVYRDAIRRLKPFIKLEGICLAVKISVYEGGNLAIDVVVKGDEIIPKDKHSLRHSGILCHIIVYTKMMCVVAFFVLLLSYL